MSFAELLDHTFSSRESDDLYYLRIDYGDPLFDRLAEDFDIPPILSDYQPEATGIWIGQRGNLTPFHHDWWHSFLAQVRGRKRYVLVHPLETRKLQRDWSPAARYELAPAPRFDPEAAERFSMGFAGLLEPGQMLYIPPYWMHQVETLDNGTISIPIRFDTEQTPDVDLFQLSQASKLRPITNQPVTDSRTLIETLRENHQEFERSEREFVDALREVRNPGLAAEDLTPGGGA